MRGGRALLLLLFLLGSLSLLVTGCDIGRHDALSVQIAWQAHNCNLGIREPDGNEYWVTGGRSPNGVFSPDMTDGGTESWVLNGRHADGPYTPLARSLDYTGQITLAIVLNGAKTSITVPIRKGEAIVSTDYEIAR